MERKVKFAPEEFYHVFSRGVEKRAVFIDKSDKDRFQALLFITNQTQTFALSVFLRKHALEEIYTKDRTESLASIVAYTLVDNHFHLLLHEHTDGGISTFMLRLLTSYSMYFNKKYQRSGPLFVHPFRSVHINSDSQFLFIFSYIHLNILDLIEGHIAAGDEKAAEKLLSEYRYSSHPEYQGRNRPYSNILNLKLVPDHILNTPIEIKLYKNWIDEIQG